MSANYAASARWRMAGIYGLLLGGAVVFCWPLIWLACTSVMMDRELFARHIHWLPESPRPQALSPYIFFNLIMGLIGTFQIFTPAFIMTQGGPVNSTLFYIYALFNSAFRYLQMGEAAAMAWFLFLIVFGLTLFQLKMSNRWVHYEGD